MQISADKMENNSKKKKDALNASTSARSSRASSSTATNVTSRASESQMSEDSSLALSQSDVVYNSNLVASSEQDITGGYNLRAHLQQIMQFSDDMESSSDENSVESFEDDDGADAELQSIVGTGQGEDRGNITPKPTTNQSINALVPVEEEDDEIDSEEENEIMKEIKAEITNNVRQEMQSELELYKAKMNSLEKGTVEGKEGDAKANADIEHLDPKLKEAFIKMRKLDKVLSKRMKREKEVKRDRILLERRIRQELKELHAEGKQEYKEIQTNEQKFLALELPKRHNEEDVDASEIDSENISCPLVMSSETKYGFNDIDDIDINSLNKKNSLSNSKIADEINKTNENEIKQVDVSAESSGFIDMIVQEHDIDQTTHLKDHTRNNEENTVNDIGHTCSNFDKVHNIVKHNQPDIDPGSLSDEEKAYAVCSNNAFVKDWLLDNIKTNWEDKGMDLFKESAIGSGNNEAERSLVLYLDDSSDCSGALESWGQESEVEGVIVPDEVTGEPVFATQLDEDEYPGLRRHSSAGQETRSTRATSKATSKRTNDDDDGSTRDDTSSVASGKTDGKKHRSKRKKDFIKRNKELASDAANAIAMTDEEKKRLDDLLKDVDNIPELPELQEDMENDSNPFQIAVCPGEGFHPDQDEMKSLTSIDSRLKEILPPEDYESIATSSMNHVPKHKLFTRTAARSDVDWEAHGDRALFQNAEQRDMNERLLAIEAELAKLHNPEEIELDTPRLGEDQLHDLIDQCVTSLSRMSMSRTSYNTDSRFSFAETESVVGVTESEDGAADNTPRTPRSARQELLDNPPRLAPDVLQKLLSEAYNPLSKQLSTLKEEDCEDDEGTPIPADVWKLISMEKIEEPVESSEFAEKDNKQNNNLKMNQVDSIQTSGSRENSYDNFQTSASVRNGFKSLSREPSNSSLNVAITDFSRDSKPLKLPEIDPTGTLVTQGLNNQRFSDNNQRTDSRNSVKTPIDMVRNSLSESKIDNNPSSSRMEILSLDGDYMSPVPPSGEKRLTGSANKSRTVTPASRPVT